MKDKDWEFDEAFYNDSLKNSKELSLEDFIGTESENSDSFPVMNEELARVVEDIKRIKALSLSGKNSKQIAKELNLEAEYIENILVTATVEDSDEAIAHLILL